MSRKAKNQSPPPVPENEVVEELDGAQITRPEHFFRPGVCGITVPRLIIRNGKATTDWQTYLRWRNDHRSDRPLPESLHVDGQRLFLQPRPANSSGAVTAAWSQQSRTAWLQGDPDVKPSNLWRMLRDTLAYFIDMPPDEEAGTFNTLACWVVLTYITPVFDAVPYLLLNGTKGSGKSRVMDVLAEIVFRPFATSDPSHAAIFRSLELFGGTLLFDESESVGRRDAPEVMATLSSLLAGNRRGRSVIRCEKDRNGSYQPRHFQVFGPKAFACINDVPHTLASRCIGVPMFRQKEGSQVHCHRLEDRKVQLQALRDALHCTALSYGMQWIEMPNRRDLCAHMSGRTYEVWQPIFAIAEWFEDHGVTGILQELRPYAAACVSRSMEVVVSPEDQALLQALTAEARAGRRKTAGEILDAARKLEPSLFGAWSGHRVAARLRNYGLTSSRLNGRPVFGPDLSELYRIEKLHGFQLGLPPMPIPG